MYGYTEGGFGGGTLLNSENPFCHVLTWCTLIAHG